MSNYINILHFLIFSRNCSRETHVGITNYNYKLTKNNNRLKRIRFWSSVKEGEEWSTCEVDGHVYKDGEFFKPASDPENNCICMPGYKGTNFIFSTN